MTRVVIIEDEPAVSAELVHLLAEAVPGVQVQAILNSVASGVAYLSQQNQVDLILSDVQLRDGLSFSIFEQVPVMAPVIFITGFDQFLVNAFNHNGIDYLLKPVSADDLQKAMQKYNRLQHHFSAQQMLQPIMNKLALKKRCRLLVKDGAAHVSLPCSEVVLFYTEQKLVYAVDKLGRKYLYDKNLSELELELDEAVFFRVNRQYIININFIRSFKTYERVKLEVELTMPNLQHVVIVSQETAAGFRKWIAGL
jgi:DNA-binding LytR/AlgR family response regulator